MTMIIYNTCLYIIIYIYIDITYQIISNIRCSPGLVLRSAPMAITAISRPQLSAFSPQSQFHREVQEKHQTQLSTWNWTTDKIRWSSMNLDMMLIDIIRIYIYIIVHIHIYVIVYIYRCIHIYKYIYIQYIHIYKEYIYMLLYLYIYVIVPIYI